MSFYESHRRRPIYYSGPLRNSSRTNVLRFAFKAVLRCMGGDLSAVVTLTPIKFTFELESEPENVQDLKLIIQASVPQSNGVTSAYSKALQIGGVLKAVTEEYDIKEDYDNKHGAPNAAASKIFMKSFFVNTKTGEKSGEMLTMVRLDEDAPAYGEYSLNLS